MRQLVCDCGWKGELQPDGTLFAGPGGQLSCPVCSAAKRNRNVEVYGNVKNAFIPPEKGWKIRYTKAGRPLQMHYYVNGVSICKRHTHYGSGFALEEEIHELEQLTGEKRPRCPRCLRACIPAMMENALAED